MKKVLSVLEEGKSARSLDLSDEEKTILKSYNLLSTKPIIYCANVNEDDVNDYSKNKYVQKVIEYAKDQGSEVVVICARIEEELTGLDEEDKKEYLETMGLKESGLNRLIKSCYSLLGLMSFLTTGEMETRAWTIKRVLLQLMPLEKSTLIFKEVL